MRDFERRAITFLAGHMLIGLMAAIAFEALLIWSDSFGLRVLILDAEDGWLAGLLLFFGLFITFGSAAMAMAVWALGRERDGGG